MGNENAEHIINALTMPIRKEAWLFGYTTLLHAVMAVLCAIHPEYEVHPALAIVFTIWDSYLLCALAMLLWRIRLGWIVAAAYTALAASEYFCCFFYGSPYDMRIIRLILETTPRESGEFVGSIVLSGATWLSIALCGASAGAAWYIVRALKRKSARTKRWIAGAVLVLVAVSCVLESPCHLKVLRTYGAPDSSVIGNIYYRPYLYSPMVRVGFGIAYNHVESRELQRLHRAITESTVSACSYESKKIVLIIGESFSKHHTPLYNADAPACSPRLDSLRRRGNLVLYEDVVTTSNLTSIVLRNLFSTRSPSDPDGWTDHSLFPIVFRHAGYEVVFVSNQLEPSGADLWSKLSGTIFNDPVLSAAQFSWRNPRCYRYDGEAIGSVPDSLRQTERPTLYIYHLYGQHWRYRDRYPEAYAAYRAEDMTTPYGGESGRQIAAEYTNATLYNDHVVDSIWSLHKDDDVVGIYLSDHGEEVYDWRDLHERTDESQINAQIARYQFETPMMFLLSDRYIASHPERAERIREAATLPYQNSRLANTLFSLAGIETSEYHAAEDILSAEYDPSLPRPIGTHDDYDEVMRHEQTETTK